MVEVLFNFVEDLIEIGLTQVQKHLNIYNVCGQALLLLFPSEDTPIESLSFKSTGTFPYTPIDDRGPFRKLKRLLTLVWEEQTLLILLKNKWNEVQFSRIFYGS